MQARTGPPDSSPIRMDDEDLIPSVVYRGRWKRRLVAEATSETVDGRAGVNPRPRRARWCSRCNTGRRNKPGNSRCGTAGTASGVRGGTAEAAAHPAGSGCWRPLDVKAYKYFLQDEHIGYVYIEKSGFVAFKYSGIRGSGTNELLWHGEWEPVNALAGLKIKFDPNATKEGWDPEAWTYITELRHLGPKTTEEANRLRYSPKPGIDHLGRQVHIVEQTEDGKYEKILSRSQ